MISLRRIRMRVTRETKSKIAWTIFISIFLVVFLDSFGLMQVYFEKDFETEFSYNLDVADFPGLVHRFKNGEKVEYQPINTNYSKVTFDKFATKMCSKNSGPLGLLILVKSAPYYFEKRAAIRATWGETEYLMDISKSILPTSSLLNSIKTHLEKNLNNSSIKTQFHSESDLTSDQSHFPIKLVFLLGKDISNQENKDTETKISASQPQEHVNFNGYRSTSADVSTPKTILHIYQSSSKEKSGKSNNQNDINTNEFENSNKSPQHRKDTSTHQKENGSNNNGKSRRLKKRNGSREEKILLNKEILKYQDIVQANFIDSYENNTYKTMMGLRWALESCNDFQYAFLVDDDMMINVKNLLKFMENPKIYPDSRVISSPIETSGSKDSDRLYAGKILNTRPVRQKLGKWYLSLEEYPFNYFPPYMPAAAIIMSKTVVEDFYYASFFAQHFRFDDVYLGILAYKLNITPLSSNYFHVCHSPDGRCADRIDHEVSKSEGDDPMGYNIIARHGLSGPKELVKFWIEQKSLGKV